MPSLHVLLGVMYLGSLSLLSGLHAGNSATVNSNSTGPSFQQVVDNCEHHTTTTSQFEEYFDIDQVGNNRSERNVVELTLYVQVHNMQEELAILLSASNRSRQHPDYGQTYELRVSNVYTVIYRETLRMSAHHSHNFNFFPTEQFRLRIQITRTGHIAVSIPGLQKSLILTVEDERTPIEVAYISFGSRMNAYPVTIHFNCIGSSAEGRPRQRRPPATPPATAGDTHPPRPQSGDGTSRADTEEDDREDTDPEREDGHGGSRGSKHADDEDGPGSPGSTPPCPVCPRPEKCEVIVKACSDTSRDLLMQPASGADGEKQKYFFYFNVYLSRKGEKGKPSVGDLAPALGASPPANQLL